MMTKRQRWELAILALLVLTWRASPMRAATLETTIAGRVVTGEFVKTSDLSPATVPGGRIELTIATQLVSAGSDIFGLLSADGILPDVESFTLVYDLNPALDKISPLPAGFKVVLPRVARGDLLNALPACGCLFMLTVDPAVRAELATNVTELKDLAVRFSLISPGRFASEAAMTDTKANVNTLSAWFDNTRTTFLHRTGPPLRQQTLLGFRDEAGALDSILGSILNGDGKITPDEEQQIASIHSDIWAQLKKYDNIMAGEPPAAEKQHIVTVTIRNGDKLKNPQVYYTYEGLFRKPPKEPYASRPFEGASSGRLTFGDYVIWVGQADRPFPPLTDQKPLRIEPAEEGPVQVVLSVPE